MVTALAKICVLAFAHPSNDGRVFFRGARPLAAAGYTVTLVARGAGKRPFRRLMRDGVRIFELPRRPASILLRLLTDPFSWFWMFIVTAWVSRGTKIYHCHEYQSLMIGYILARIRRSRVIYDCHEYQPEGFAGLFAPKGSKRYTLIKNGFERFERFCTRRVDAVVTVNDELGMRFRRDTDRVAVVPNYSSVGEFETPVSPPASWQEKLHDREVLVYAGYVSPDRGILACVRLLGAPALRKRPTVLLLAGAVSDRFRRQLVDLGTELGVANRLFFTGRITHDEMLGHIRLGAVGMNLILPSPEKNNWAEPTKVFQYSMAGLPIISSPVTASLRLVQAMGNGIIVNPNDPENAAEAIAALIADPQRMRTLGEAGRRAFRERFNLEAVLPRMLKLYKALADYDDSTSH